MKDDAMNQHAPPRSNIRDPQSEVRIGVVVCECGGKISDRLDTEFLLEEARTLPSVVYAARDAYPCSKDGRARIARSIADHNLGRVLIAGCAPRLVERMFRQTGQLAGLERGCTEVADIGERCAGVRADPKTATREAAASIEMGVARLAAIDLPRVHTSRVVGSAMVIGGGLSGLTAALALADSGIGVTLIDRTGALGGPRPDLASQSRELASERIESVSRHPRIQILLNACVTGVSGRPGDYEVRVAHADQSSVFAAGAIVVAEDALPRKLGSDRWYDRSRVKTQIQFEQELDAASQAGGDLSLGKILMILCAEEAGGRCSRVCCMAAIRQAIRAKQIDRDASITILFRNLYLGGSGDQYADELHEAQDLGVTFFRYPKDHSPVIGDESVDVPDPLTGEALHLPFDRAVLSMPLEPPHSADRLAALLRVPQDERGFMIEPRIRLRPDRYVDDGIYVLGGAHQPVDNAEALFQAYVTGARARRFLSQDEIRVEAAVAEVNAALCTGDGHCVLVCPTAALTLTARNDGCALSLARVEPLRCIGCGNCVVACPVKAIGLPGWDDAAILAQISAALQPRGEESSTARVVAFACEWSAYASADMAGARRAPYPNGVRMIRLPCSARLDPDHVLWAFVNGADGVFLGVCPPGDCHCGAGNLYARERLDVLRKQLADRGFDPSRLRLEFLPGDDGERFAQVMTEFVGECRQVAGR
jgi:heterodisulfide reductase subunit A